MLFSCCVWGCGTFLCVFIRARWGASYQSCSVFLSSPAWLPADWITPLRRGENKSHTSPKRNMASCVRTKLLRQGAASCTLNLDHFRPETIFPLLQRVKCENSLKCGCWRFTAFTWITFCGETFRLQSWKRRKLFRSQPKASSIIYLKGIYAQRIIIFINHCLTS